MADLAPYSFDSPVGRVRARATSPASGATAPGTVARAAPEPSVGESCRLDPSTRSGTSGAFSSALSAVGETDAASDPVTPDPDAEAATELAAADAVLELGAPDTGTEAEAGPVAADAVPELGVPDTGAEAVIGLGAADTGADAETEPAGAAVAGLGAADTGADAETELGAADTGADAETEPGAADTGVDAETEPGAADTGAEAETEPGAAEPGAAETGAGADETGADAETLGGTGVEPATEARPLAAPLTGALLEGSPPSAVAVPAEVAPLLGVAQRAPSAGGGGGENQSSLLDGVGSAGGLVPLLSGVACRSSMEPPDAACRRLGNVGR
ncbi:hypothetical protein [Actinoplanes sp. NPDC048796]|uniref:hypothetical protein n=1 Tax=Actinoplanes sp. NPDC048796 TaxID=3155640 RepID=UPI0033EA634A